MKKKLLMILILLCFSIQVCHGALVTIIERDLTYSFTKNPGNVVTLEAKDPNIQGWDVTSDNVVLDEDDSFVMPDEDVTIEALYFAPAQAALIVNKYGVITSEYKTIGSTVTVSAPPGKDFIFKEWAASGITLTASQKTSTSITFTMPNTTVRLVTIYEDNLHTLTVNPGGNQYQGLETETVLIEAPSEAPYILTYNYKDGVNQNKSVAAYRHFSSWSLSGKGSINSSTAEQVTYTYGNADGTLTANYTTDSITLPNPIREGYTFLGWSASSTATTASYNAGSSYTPTQDTTLYAVWQINTYKVTFNANGGSGTMTDQTFTYGTPQNLKANTYTRSGATFAGWSLTSGGNVRYLDQESYSAVANITLYAVWEENTYTVTFNANGGTGTMAPQGFTYGVSKNLSINAFTRVGYTFAGWATTAGGTVAYANGASYTASGNATLYAVWTINTYSVSFNSNNGSGTMTAQTFSHGVAQNLKANAFTKEGHTFAGWSTTPGGVVAYTNQASYTAIGDATLYAVWNVNTYTVTFNANGGTGTMAAQTFKHGISQNLSTNEFTKTGYVFAGWATSADGTVAYINRASYSATADVTLYAVWGINTYTVTFNANTGEGTMAPQVFTHGVEQNLNANTFTKEGHTFAGWATSAGGIVTYANQASYTTTGNATLYAVWTANTYTVTFDANGGSGTMTAQTFTYGVAQNLNANTFTKTGYSLVGWSTVQGGAVAYANQASYTAYGDAVLYAVWGINTYTVTFNANGGTGSMAPQTFTYGESKSLTVNSFIRNGYTFAGWATSAGGTVAYANGARYTSTGNATLYAVWEIKSYEVMFNSNGGSGSMSAQTFIHGVAQNLTANAFVKSGYTFAGWSTTPGGTVTYANQASYTAYGDAVLYAVWGIDTYTVTFNANGGTGTMSAQTFTHGISQNLTLNSFTRSGYTFMGWATTSGGTVAYINGASYSTTTDVTLYAVWTLNTYEIAFNSNGGNGSMANQVFTHGVAQNLSTNLFTRTGYTFAGWAISQYGSVEYADGASYTATTGATLYAVWNINTYTVTFDANGGTGTMAPQTFTYGVAQNLTLNSFTKEGYMFKGWATTSTGIVEYIDGISYSTSVDVTLYAVWEEVSEPGRGTITVIYQQGGTIDLQGTTSRCSVCGGTDHECGTVNITIEAGDSDVIPI